MFDQLSLELEQYLGGVPTEEMEDARARIQFRSEVRRRPLPHG